MPKEKHEALRTCIGTGKEFPKKEMIRFVRKFNGEVVIDLKGKEKGRGANLSMSQEAFELAVKKKAFQRTLKLTKPLSEAEIANLRKKFAEAIEQKQFRPSNKPVTIKVSEKEFSEKLG
jgi:hypothetical protein